MTMVLNELKRAQNIQQTIRSDDYDDKSKGKNRYFRRMHQRVEKSVQKLNQLDVTKLFSQGILDINLDVQGETNMYTVRISFGRFLAELHRLVMQDEGRLTLATITKALTNAFNSDDILVRCNCDDFQYRQAYWLSRDGGIAGEMETRPSDKTNPNDTKGRGCKHIQAVLSNSGWISRVSRVIYNYINYMKEHFEGLYAEKIYPAIFEKDYDELYQRDLDFMNKDDLNDKELHPDTDTIDTSNKWAKEKNYIKRGWNKSEDDIPDDDIEGQMSLNFDEPTEKKFDIDSLY